jgi:hypothetical protein
MTTTVKDLYRFPGFRPLSRLLPHPQDSKGYVLKLQRRQKKQYVLSVAKQFMGFGLVASIGCEILMQGMPTYILSSNTGGCYARTVEL